MSFHGRFSGAVKKGLSGVQAAHAKQRVAAEERAKRRIEMAKTKYEKARIRAELEREKLKLQREMYEAKAAVQRERASVAKAKRDAGVVSLSERAEGFLRGLTTPKRKRVVRRRKQGSSGRR